MELLLKGAQNNKVFEEKRKQQGMMQKKTKRLTEIKF